LSLAPDVPRDDLWKAIAEAVIDINERIAALEAQAAARHANYPEGGTRCQSARTP
jgi:hypothetical protein